MFTSSVRHNKIWPINLYCFWPWPWSSTLQYDNYYKGEDDNDDDDDGDHDNDDNAVDFDDVNNNTKFIEEN